MFIGEYRHNLDDKGRLALPVKFRKQIRGAIITRGLDKCLWVFNKAEWEKLATKLAALPLARSDSRALVRLMMAGAMEAPLDGQGRVLVPDYLRRYAGLSAKGGSPPDGRAGASGGKRSAVIVAGLYNRVEIWDEKRWTTYRTKTESTSDEIAEKLGELGI